jgi:nucleoside-diphosphate-sugar epimerase
MRVTDAAMRYLDETVTGAGGIALRYGGFYGAPNDGMLEPVRQFPIVGDGGGVSSFIHLDDDAAAATVLALEHDGAGIYIIVDDEPAQCASGSQWSPTRSAPSRHATFPAGSRGCSRARPW